SCWCSWSGPAACWAAPRRRRARPGGGGDLLSMRGRALAPYGRGLAALLVIPPVLDSIPAVAPGYILYLVSLGLIYAIVAIGFGALVCFTAQRSPATAAVFS